MEEIQARWEVPKIAHFCSLFKDALDVPDYDIEELEEALVLDEEDNVLLLDLIFRLLNGCYGRCDIGAENYELYLKDIFSYRLEEELKKENPLKTCTFFQLSAEQKIQVLDNLCDFRLDAEDVALNLKDMNGECMRVEPLGTDARGAKYWYFYGTRLYREAPPPEKKASQKSTKKRRKEDKQREVIDSSEDESLVQPTQDPEEEEELKTQTVRKAARLRVNLEKKDDDDCGDDYEDIGLDIKDGVESLKLSSDDEYIEEVMFEDHSSDEDYVERGTKKRNGKRRKKVQAGRPSKVSKTPAPKSARVPHILRVTPRSARLRAKFGFMHKDTRDSRTSIDDQQSSSSQSTTQSDRWLKKSKRQLKKKSDSNCTSDENEITIVEELNKNDDGMNAENKSVDKMEAENNNINITDDYNVNSENTDADIAADKSTTSNQHVQWTKAQERDACGEMHKGVVIDEEQRADGEKGQVDNKEQNSDSSKMGKQKSDVNEDDDSVDIDTDFIKQEVVDVERLGSTMDQDYPDISKDGVKIENGKLHQESVKQKSCSMASFEQEPEVTPRTSVKQKDNYIASKACFKQEYDKKKTKVSVKEETEELTLAKTNHSLINRRVCRYRLEKEDTDSQDSKAPSLTSIISDRMTKPWSPRVETTASLKTGWHLVCEVTEDWQHLITVLDEDSGCTTNQSQRALVKLLKDNFLPEIPAILEEKEKERKRREQELAPRRLSTRLLYKKKEQEDRERILKEAQLEEDRLKAEEEEERKRRQEEERKEEQRRQREERDRAREERARRVKLREERAKFISEGKEIPPELMNGIKSDGPALEEQTLDEDVVARLHKVLGVCFKHEESWPFVESVEEKIAPGYFDIIKMPMNLSEMEEKLKYGKYHSKDDFVADMDLIVDNCENYNGEQHDFSIMARNLRTAFQQAMRRFFPQGRQKKDDDDFVLEGKEGRTVQLVSRRYKARREASKKALDSFQSILNEADDSSDNQIIYKPVVSGALHSQNRSFQGYVSGRSNSTVASSANSPGTPVLSTRLVNSGGKQLILMSQSTEVLHKPGSSLIEVRTIQPANQGASKPATPHKIALVQRAPGATTPDTLTAILNSPAGDGSGQKVRYIIPSSMVSLLKDRSKPTQEAGTSCPVYVSISRPIESQPTVMVTSNNSSSSVTTSGNLTSVLSTIHHSGGMVLEGKGSEVGAGRTPLGKSLLKSAILQSPARSSAPNTTPVVVAGKGVITVPGKKQVIVAGTNQLLGGNTGNIQLVAVSGNNPGNKSSNIQLVALPRGSQPITRTVHIVAPGGNLTAENSSVGTAKEGAEGPSTVLGTSSPAGTQTIVVPVKGEEMKVTTNALHISKETYMRLLAEKKIRLVQQGPGGKPVIHLQPGVQLVQRTALPSQAATVTSPAVNSPGQGVTAPVGRQGTSPVVPTMKSQGQGSPRPMIISALPGVSVVKNVVVNPWSVSDRTVATNSSPLYVSSVGVEQSVAASASPGVAQEVTAVLSSVTPTVAQNTSSDLTSALPASVTSIAAISVTNTVTTGVASLVDSQCALSCAQVVTTSVTNTPTTNIPVLTSPVCSLTGPSVHHAIMPVSSPLTGTQGTVGTGCHKASDESTSSTIVTQTGPVSAGSQIVLSGFPSAQRSIFNASSPLIVQTVSSCTPSLVTSVYDSQSAAVVSPKTVSTAGCVVSPVYSSVAIKSESDPSVLQTAHQPLMQRTVHVCTSSVAPENVQQNSLQKGCKSAASSMVFDSHVASSSLQEQESGPLTANSSQSLTQVSRKKVLMHRSRTVAEEESESCQNSITDIPFDQSQNNEDLTVQGRSRRNVVSRDYKAFAGFISKSGSASRRTSTSKAAIGTPDMDLPCVGKASRLTPLKRASVDMGDQSQAKVAYLSPTVVLNDCSVAMIHGGYSMSVTQCAVGGSKTSAGPKQTVQSVSHITPSTAIHRQEPAMQSSHQLCDQENMNTEGHSVESPAGDLNMLDGSVSSPQPDVITISSMGNRIGSSKSPLKYADRNVFQQILSEASVTSPEKSPRDDASVSS